MAHKEPARGVSVPLNLFKDGSSWSFTPVTRNGGGLFLVRVHAAYFFPTH